jgi:hypothetical protein
MHIDRAKMLRHTTKAGSSRSKPGRWSRMAVAICSLGGCVISSPPAYDKRGNIFLLGTMIIFYSWRHPSD